jgi:hypothetical protein
MVAVLDEITGSATPEIMGVGGVAVVKLVVVDVDDPLLPFTDVTAK